MTISVAPESPKRPDVADLLAYADVYYAGLYAAGHNHLLDADALLDPAVAFLACRNGERLCGFGAVVDRASFAELKRMYVADPARGRGMGRLLLAALEDRARAMGHGLVRLETGIRQPEALALYRRSGYRDRGPFPPYRTDPMSVFMEKALA